MASGKIDIKLGVVVETTSFFGEIVISFGLTSMPSIILASS